jgi:hypothetical protein
LQIHKIETFLLLYSSSQTLWRCQRYKSLPHLLSDSNNDQHWYRRLGECVDWLPTLQKGFHERIILYLLGKSVADRINLVSTLKKWHSRSSTAVSMALTEIMAKVCGVSVCDLGEVKLERKCPNPIRKKQIGKIIH